MRRQIEGRTRRPVDSTPTFRLNPVAPPHRPGKSRTEPGGTGRTAAVQGRRATPGRTEKFRLLHGRQREVVVYFEFAFVSFFKGIQPGVGPFAAGAVVVEKKSARIESDPDLCDGKTPPPRNLDRGL